MRAISSFIFFKSVINAELKVIWIPDAGLNIAYKDIFKLNSNFELSNPEPEFKYNLFVNKKTLTENNLLVIRKLVSLYNNLLGSILGFDCLIFDPDVKKGVEHLKKICRNKKNILVITGNQCLDYPEGFSSFVPIHAVATKIKAAKANFKDHMIGIHIRRSDHKKAIQNSPNYLFEDKIIEYLSLDKDDFGVFLATDDPKTAEYFEKKYPEVVMTYPKTYGRSSKEGMIDAVVEMYLLASTKKIYGSYWSSFSGVAKRIYGNELEILHV